ncbi:MAG: chemotaxis response regulator protein-glutamate methylesterase [Planctomycetes bacterium]|nr:chemotaxis response regulator protein-glutamate methylesterase [Planctomycetota bacterium]
MAGRIVRVLVVDDSPFVRRAVQSALRSHPQIEVVGTAGDGIEGLQKIAALRPDVVTLDIEMPRLNGIGVLERAAGKVPVGFVMVSTLTESGARITLEALRKGAIDYVTKPQHGGVTLPEFRANLQQKVLAAAQSKHKVGRMIGRGEAASEAPMLPPNTVRGWVVTIGISCGGPQTLNEMLPKFPSDFVPILITQHMPAQFTPAFATHLAACCAMRVREASDGERIEHGTIYIAPGSHHLRVVRRGVNLLAKLDDGPLTAGHKPSADVMFAAVAKACGSRSIGVVMTGMGSDGAHGLSVMKQAGAKTIAQDQETSLVYGMPKVAVATGDVDHVLPLGRIPQGIARLLRSGSPAAKVT